MAPHIYPEPHSCARCFSPKLLFSFHGSALDCTGVDAEVYMFDLFYDEAFVLAADSSPGKNDGCPFMKWLIAKLPPVLDAPGWGQLQALVGEHGSVKTHLYLQWVDGRYTPWLRSFRSADGLYRPPAGRTGKEGGASTKKDANDVKRRSSGLIRGHPIRIEDEVEIMGVLEKDWQQETAEEKGHYLLADEPVDDSGDEFHDETEVSFLSVEEGTNSVKTNVLRNESLFQWLVDIPHAELPETVKDAVHITLVLGLRHLWVDAFCIIQNDIHEKHEEIQKMGHIYGNAEVTISASRASTCHDGFLQSRQTSEEGSFAIPFRCLDGKTEGKSLISSRMLEFGTHQTRWHCSCTRYGVPHAHGSPNVDDWTRDKIEKSPVNIDWAPVVVGTEEVDRFRNRVPTMTHRRLEKHVVQTWKRLIRNYTRRAVSDPMDRLPALSAIAQRLEALSTYGYASGSWFGDDVAHQLLFWYPVDAETVTRSPEKAAPSWSWASVIGAVDFLDVPGKIEIAVLKVTQHELVVWGMLCKAIVWLEDSKSVGLFHTGVSEYEVRHPFEGDAILEAPSFAPNLGQRGEVMYLLEVDRENGTGLAKSNRRRVLQAREV
ncbi:hypothetical protein B0T20DRAFT_452635 [Sordaria brevicollis]|uniref:Heterokaryon incompatibility domain-containing protein n=1 Tax=Sordaria brevicollis TaxID=83679 RepID=A0AAE0PFN9_SORBR|nr:hypothetical protein B0T20DRAFT_452635 [Sordaria brevicollis]